MQARSICRAIVAIMLLMPGCGANELVKVDEFHDAITSNDTSRVKSLLAKDATLANSRDHQGSTALHFALLRPDLEIAAALLNAGADPNARDETGELPINYHFHNAHALKLLIDHGANRDSLDAALLSVQMHLSQADGVTELIGLLRHAGAGRGESLWWGMNRKLLSQPRGKILNETDAPYRIWLTEEGKQMMILKEGAVRLGASTPVNVFSFSRDLALVKRGHVHGGVQLSSNSRVVEICFESTQQGKTTKSPWYTAIAERGGENESEPSSGPNVGPHVSIEEIRDGQVTIHFIRWDTGPYPTKQELSKGLRTGYPSNGDWNGVVWNHQLVNWRLRDVDRNGPD